MLLFGIAWGAVYWFRESKKVLDYREATGDRFAMLLPLIRIPIQSKLQGFWRIRRHRKTARG